MINISLDYKGLVGTVIKQWHSQEMTCLFFAMCPNEYMLKYILRSISTFGIRILHKIIFDTMKNRLKCTEGFIGVGHRLGCSLTRKTKMHENKLYHKNVNVFLAPAAQVLCPHRATSRRPTPQLRVEANVVLPQDAASQWLCSSTVTSIKTVFFF